MANRGAQNPYPDNWPEIAQRVKAMANWRCVRCGHAHDPGNGYCLTVHHVDGDPANCHPDNLLALCQRCHLAMQARFPFGQRVMSFAFDMWWRNGG